MNIEMIILTLQEEQDDGKMGKVQRKPMASYAKKTRSIRRDGWDWNDIAKITGKFPSFG